MKRLLSLVSAVLLATAMPALAAVYAWNGAGGDLLWTNANNWTPARSAPNVGDTISFANGKSDTVTGIPTQTISTLMVGALTAVHLQSEAGARKTLTVGDSLCLAVRCQLNLNGAADTMTIFVAAGGVGQINGSMTFSGMAHKLNASDAGAIQFNIGSTFAQNCASSVFTNSGTANAIVFNAGSEFIQYAGSNPFGLGQPNSKVLFQPGSWFRCRMSGPLSFSGRSYANFELDFPTFSYTATGGNPTSLDTLQITDGKLTFGLSRINIKGDILIAAAETLQFRQVVSGGAACSLKFYGTTPQTIGGAGTLLFLNDSTSVYVNNAAGLTINRVFPVGYDLGLFEGIVTANDTLKMLSDQAVQRTNGYVVGNLALHTAIGATTKDFPVGTANGYSPVSVTFGAVGTAGRLTARAVQGSHPNVSIAAFTLKRYWTLNNDGILAFDNYEAVFNYLTDDFTAFLFPEDPNENTMVAGKYDAGNWTFPTIGARTPGGTADGGSVQLTGLTSFSDFTFGKNSTSIDAIPPTIVWTSPADGDSNVALNENVIYAFSEPMDTASFKGYSVPDHAFTKSWNTNFDTLTLTPDTLYELNTTYALICTTGTDPAGNFLTALPDSFMFTTTGDTIKPAIVSTSPANGATNVALNKNVIIAFSEPMDTASFKGYSVPDHAFTKSWNTNFDTLTLTPDTLYEYNTAYTLVYTTGTDLAGNPLAVLPDSFMFTTMPTGVEGKPGGVKPGFFLSPVAPNPVMASAEFRFGLAQDQQVSLEIYNVLGQKVKTLAEGRLASGSQTVKWNGRDENGRNVPSGVYVYRLKAGDNTSTRRFTVIR
ncbi:Ig-like domain-containing protein [candidate division TA06 bacterium]|uniref:Ig-like domain-containing protein n=1 Tax=candidate division TA06 bacterium TaxID=2250710 RepID=A0A933I728_UNCT6|nr:Ig-like domain-containing protein [candidate division TA06 bacterium]